MAKEACLQEVTYTAYTFKEGGSYVAYVPELDLSGCGATCDEARKNIQDAVRGFVETSADRGTLAEILEEAGYVREGDSWRAPEFVSLDRLTTKVG